MVTVDLLVASWHDDHARLRDTAGVEAPVVKSLDATRGLGQFGYVDVFLSSDVDAHPGVSLRVLGLHLGQTEELGGAVDGVAPVGPGEQGRALLLHGGGVGTEEGQVLLLYGDVVGSDTPDSVSLRVVDNRPRKYCIKTRK